jgi:ankyrin repeat protein
MHVAVKCAYTPVVRLLLERDIQPSSLELRDRNGATPLHHAVKAGYAEITRLLLQAGADAGLGTAVAENGMGDTVGEMALQQYLQERLCDDALGGVSAPNTLSAYEIDLTPMPIQSDAALLERRLGDLKRTVAMLFADGKLTQGSELTKALEAFVERMEGKLAVAHQTLGDQMEDENMQSNVYQSDEVDRRKTLEHVRRATARQAIPRQLVHLLDVQSLVQSQLAVQKTREEEVARWEKERARREADFGQEEEDTEPKLKTGIIQSWAGGLGPYLFKSDTL